MIEIDLEDAYCSPPSRRYADPRDLAVFATVPGSSPYKFLQRAFHACSMRPGLLLPIVTMAF